MCTTGWLLGVCRSGFDSFQEVRLSAEAVPHLSAYRPFEKEVHVILHSD